LVGTLEDFSLVAEGMRDFTHGSQMLLCIPEVLSADGVIRLDVSLKESLKGLVMLVPLTTTQVRLSLSGLCGSRLACLGRLTRAGLFLASLLVLALVLPLPATRGCGGSRRRRGSRLSSSAVVIVNPPHVVSQVPLTGKSMSGKRAFAALISAEIRLLTMAMHGVGLTLMPEEASSGRKPGVLATLNLAAVGLQVGINELAVE